MNYFSIFIALICQQFAYSDIHEKRLYEKLIADYNVLERPVENSSHPIVVHMKLTLQQIIDVDEKNQLIVTNAWLEYRWLDYRLQWDPTEYGNVKDLRFPSDKLWRPDILLFNSVDSNFDSTYHSNLVVYSDGQIVWVPPGNLRSSCNINIKWFPFDDQECYLKFGSWTYSSFKLDLQLVNDTIDDSEYIQNGEWKLIGKPAKRNVTPYDYGVPDEEFIDLKFYLQLRRRILYYAFNMIVPSLVILLMTILGFALPVESGEKVTLEITILLSICVFLNMVSQMTPSTSEAVPLIVVFFSCNMLIVASSVVLNVLILSLHYRTPDTHRMSKWMEVLLLNWLPSLLCMQRPGHQFKRDSMVIYLKAKWNEFWKKGTDDSAIKRPYAINSSYEVINREWSFCEECDRFRNSVGAPNSDRATQRGNGQSVLPPPLFGKTTTAKNDDIWQLTDSTSKSFSAMIESLTRIHNSLLFITQRLQKDEDEQEAINNWK